jgi:hypothetical protein
MDPHPTTSSDSGNCTASAGAAVSRSLSRLTYEWRDEPRGDRGHLSYVRSGWPAGQTQFSAIMSQARQTTTSDGVLHH